jgi:[ribosomal protein S18]-alanine N-acetyltransferase
VIPEGAAMVLYSDLNPVLSPELTENQLSFVAELEKKISQNPWSLDQLKEEFRNPYSHFFKIDSRAYLFFRVVDGQAHILGLGVDPQYRRQGLATKLMRLVDKTRVKSIFLEVRESNYGAIQAYLSLGFSKLNLIKSFYSDGEAALVMLKK